MPLTVGGIHPVDELVSGVLNSAVPGEDAYIGLRALQGSLVDVASRDYSGKLWVETVRPFMGQRDEPLKRGPLAQYQELNTEDPTTVSYTCEERAAKRTVPRQIALRSQFPEDLRDREATIVRRALLDDLDVTLAATMFAAGTYTNDADLTAVGNGVSGNKFGAAGADELGDLFIVATLARAQNHGIPISQQSMLIGQQAMDFIRISASFRSYIGDNRMRAVIPQDQALEALGASLGISPANIHVAGARSETANPNQTSSESFIWTQDSILFYYDGLNNPMQMTGGARVSSSTFALVFEEGASIDGFAWSTDDPPADVVAGAWSYDLVTIDETSAYLVTDCV